MFLFLETRGAKAGSCVTLFPFFRMSLFSACALFPHIAFFRMSSFFACAMIFCPGDSYLSHQANYSGWLHELLGSLLNFFWRIFC